MDKQTSNKMAHTLYRFTELASVLVLAISLVACDGSENIDDPNAAPYLDEKGMIIRGALLYDNWIKLKTDEGVTIEFLNADNPLWGTRALNTSNVTSGDDTWRCVNCHGWDYQGRDGDFNSDNASNYTNFSGLMFTSKNIADGHIMEDAINVITDGFMNQTQLGETFHAFGGDTGWLNEQDIAALIKFLENGILDTRLYISENNPVNGYQRALGAAENGQNIFGSIGKPICATCHHDGAPIAPDNVAISTLSRVDPFQALHKIRFGAPYTPPPQEQQWAVMPGMMADDYPMHDIMDVLTYIQTIN